MVYLKVTFTVPLFVHNVNIYILHLHNIFIVHLHYSIYFSILGRILVIFSLILAFTFDKSCTII